MFLDPPSLNDHFRRGGRSKEFFWIPPPSLNDHFRKKPAAGEKHFGFGSFFQKIDGSLLNPPNDRPKWKNPQNDP